MEKQTAHQIMVFTFLDSGFGVPSTLLLIFWPGFILSMPNSEPGGIPWGLDGRDKQKRIRASLTVAAPPQQRMLRLTGGVVGHVPTYRIRPRPALVHHTVHAVHTWAVGGA